MTVNLRSELLPGKWSLTAAFLGMMVAPNVLAVYTQALFLQPLEQEFGWTRVEVSFGVTLLILALALSAPVAGYLSDRLPVRWLVVGSTLVVAANFFMLSRATGNLLSYYLPMTLMSLIGAGCSTPSFSRIVVTHFSKYRGTAMGIAMSGTGVVTIVTPIFLGPLVISSGWRIGYLALATFELLAALVFFFLLRNTGAGGRKRAPHDEVTSSFRSSMTLKEASATSQFWLLAILFIVLQLIVTGLLTQMAAVLVDRGMQPVAAAKAASGVGVAILISRLFTGYLIDRVFAPYVACAILLLSASGLAIMLLGGARFGFYGALAAGLVIGSEIDLIGYLVVRYFGLRHFGRIYGLLYTFLLVGTAVSPLLYAKVYELQGNYHNAITASVAGLVVCALLCLRLPRFQYDVAIRASTSGDSKT